MNKCQRIWRFSSSKPVIVLPATAFDFPIISFADRYFAVLSERCSVSGAPKPVYSIDHKGPWLIHKLQYLNSICQHMDIHSTLPQIIIETHTIIGLKALHQVRVHLGKFPSYGARVVWLREGRIHAFEAINPGLWDYTSSSLKCLRKDREENICKRKKIINYR